MSRVKEGPISASLVDHIRSKHAQGGAGGARNQGEANRYHERLHNGDTHSDAGNPTHHHSSIGGENTHPGFKRVQTHIAAQEDPRRPGHKIGEERAGAILAARSRNASTAAKRRNPDLRKVNT